MSPVRITRDLFTYMVGVAGVFHETVIQELDRPAFFIGFLGLLGAPFFLRRDESRPVPAPESKPEAGP